jgi:hypothetical protein
VAAVRRDLRHKGAFRSTEELEIIFLVTHPMTDLCERCLTSVLARRAILNYSFLFSKCSINRQYFKTKRSNYSALISAVVLTKVLISRFDRYQLLKSFSQIYGSKTFIYCQRNYFATTLQLYSLARKMNSALWSTRN